MSVVCVDKINRILAKKENIKLRQHRVANPSTLIAKITVKITIWVNQRE